MIFLCLIVIFSFVLMHVIEMISFGSRVAGRVTRRVALGTTLQQTIYTTSRFLLIPFLPTLGYLVESGIMINDYLILVISAFILTFFMSIFVIVGLNKLQHFFQVVFNKYTNKTTIPTAILRALIDNKLSFDFKSCNSFSKEKIIFKKVIVSFIAYLFLITGFFVAFMLAIMYPENRLTLSQFTATFHGFGAIIVAFYLDPMLSRSIDNRTDDVVWLNNVYSILLGRSLSYLAIILLVSVFLLLKMFF
jgi:hypothetical protein